MLASLPKATLLLLGLVVMIVCVLGIALGMGGTFSNPAGEHDQAVTATPRRASKSGIPPMDAATPVRTETATFALG